MRDPGESPHGEASESTLPARQAIAHIASRADAPAVSSRCRCPAETKAQPSSGDNMEAARLRAHPPHVAGRRTLANALKSSSPLPQMRLTPATPPLIAG